MDKSKWDGTKEKQGGPAPALPTPHGKLGDCLYECGQQTVHPSGICRKCRRRNRIRALRIDRKVRKRQAKDV